MKRKILISILCCLLLALGAGLAQAAPSVKISGNNITIEEGVTDSILAEIKAAGVKNPNFALKKISSTEDLAKICSQYPDMTELNLEGTKDLTSIEPLAGLKKLKQIVFVSKTVADLSPLSGLTAMEGVEIRADSMGPDLKWMSGMKNLRRIRISAGRSLVSFEGIPSLPGLRMINFQNAAPADLTPLQALPELISIDLQGAIVPDMTPLAALSKLQQLSLYGAVVKDFSPLAKCPALRDLNYYATKEADYSTLGKLTQVETLKGGMTKLSDISWIAGLTNLKSFRMFSEDVTDYSPLAKVQLEELTIWDMKNPVGDLSFLSKMTSLKTLKLWTLEGVSNLGVLKNLTNLETLEMTKINTKGGEAIPLDVIKKLPNLKEFVVTKGVFTDDKLTGFANPKLRISQR